VSHDQEASNLLRAWLTLDELTDSPDVTVRLADDQVTMARLAGDPIVWGPKELMRSERGLVAMELYELLGLDGSGVTVRLVEPEGYYCGAPYTRRIIQLEIEEPIELTASQRDMVDQLDDVEASLNKKGWSMG